MPCQLTEAALAAPRQVRTTRILFMARSRSLSFPGASGVGVGEAGRRGRSLGYYAFGPIRPRFIYLRRCKTL
jgi:hypothetical protein